MQLSHRSHTWVEGAVTWRLSNAMTVKTHVLPVPDLACTIRSGRRSMHYNKTLLLFAFLSSLAGCVFMIFFNP